MATFAVVVSALVIGSAFATDSCKPNKPGCGGSQPAYAPYDTITTTYQQQTDYLTSETVDIANKTGSCSSNYYHEGGRCGPEYRNLRCTYGLYCSRYGYCGLSPEHQKDPVCPPEERPDVYPLTFVVFPDNESKPVYYYNDDEFDHIVRIPKPIYILVSELDQYESTPVVAIGTSHHHESIEYDMTPVPVPETYTPPALASIQESAAYDELDVVQDEYQPGSSSYENPPSNDYGPMRAPLMPTFSFDFDIAESSKGNDIEQESCQTESCGSTQKDEHQKSCCFSLKKDQDAAQPNNPQKQGCMSCFFRTKDENQEEYEGTVVEPVSKGKNFMSCYVRPKVEYEHNDTAAETESKGSLSFCFTSKETEDEYNDTVSEPKPKNNKGCIPCFIQQHDQGSCPADAVSPPTYNKKDYVMCCFKPETEHDENSKQDEQTGKEKNKGCMTCCFNPEAEHNDDCKKDSQSGKEMNMGCMTCRFKLDTEQDESYKKHEQTDKEKQKGCMTCCFKPKAEFDDNYKKDQQTDKDKRKGCMTCCFKPKAELDDNYKKDEQTDKEKQKGCIPCCFKPKAELDNNYKKDEQTDKEKQKGCIPCCFKPKAELDNIYKKDEQTDKKMKKSCMTCCFKPETQGDDIYKKNEQTGREKEKGCMTCCFKPKAEHDDDDYKKDEQTDKEKKKGCMTCCFKPKAEHDEKSKHEQTGKEKGCTSNCFPFVKKHGAEPQHKAKGCMSSCFSSKREENYGRQEVVEPEHQETGCCFRSKGKKPEPEQYQCNVVVSQSKEKTGCCFSLKGKKPEQYQSTVVKSESKKRGCHSSCLPSHDNKPVEKHKHKHHHCHKHKCCCKCHHRHHSCGKSKSKSGEGECSK